MYAPTRAISQAYRIRSKTFLCTVVRIGSKYKKVGTHATHTRTEERHDPFSQRKWISAFREFLQSALRSSDRDHRARHFSYSWSENGMKIWLLYWMMTYATVRRPQMLMDGRGTNEHARLIMIQNSRPSRTRTRHKICPQGSIAHRIYLLLILNYQLMIETFLVYAVLIRHKIDIFLMRVENSNDWILKF